MPQSNVNTKIIAVIGGTGKEGSGLAFRWAQAGYDVIIGSRALEKAQQAALDLNRLLRTSVVRSAINSEAAHEADIAVVTVPYSAHHDTLQAISAFVQNKVVVDVTVPVIPPKVTVVSIPPGRTAAEEAQSILGPAVMVVSAFQNVSAHHLKERDHAVQCDVLVAGDSEDAKNDVIALAEAAGLRGIDVGPLSNAIVAESLTPILLGINKRYKSKGAGIRITEIG